MGPCRRRAKGRPQSRWRDEFINDLEKRKLRTWSEIVKDREAWSDLVQRTRPMWGCSDGGRRRRRGGGG